MAVDGICTTCSLALDGVSTSGAEPTTTVAAAATADGVGTSGAESTTVVAVAGLSVVTVTATSNDDGPL